MSLATVDMPQNGNAPGLSRGHQQQDSADIALLSKLTDTERYNLDQMESIAKESELVMCGNAGRIVKAFAMAQGIQAMRVIITNEMMSKYVMPLMNTRLGFKTDKNPNQKKKDKEGQWVSPSPYAMEVVKDCVIETLLRGGQIVGNEMNIISGQAYFTKEFFMRAVGALPGVTNVVASPGVPKMEQGKAVIRYGLSWRVNGRSDSLKDATGSPGRVFEIRTDAYSSVDQVIGKADRKAYAAAYRQITGSQLADGDVDFVEGAVVTSGPDQTTKGASSLADKLRASQPNASPVGPDNQHPAESSATMTSHTPSSDAASGGENGCENVNKTTGEVKTNDGDQRTFPPLPDAKLPQEKFIDLVAGICGMEMGDAENALKLCIARHWPLLSREGQTAWWKAFGEGKKSGLLPKV